MPAHAYNGTISLSINAHHLCVVQCLCTSWQCVLTRRPRIMVAHRESLVDLWPASVNRSVWLDAVCTVLGCFHGFMETRSMQTNI